MNNINDDFMIEKYVHKPIHEDVDSSDKVDFDSIHYTLEDIEEAKKWGYANNRVIIYPCGTLPELEDLWEKFNLMIKKHRRESDWKSLEIFGITNMRNYDYIKSALLSVSIEDSRMAEAVLESVSELGQDVDFDSIKYTSGDISDAIAWSSEFNRAIIYPTLNLQDLEKLWDNYNLMIKKHRRESDWKSQEIFGISNLRHYEYLKSKFLKYPIPNAEDAVYSESNNVVCEMNIEPEFFYTKYMENVFNDPGVCISEFREAALTALFSNKTTYESCYMNKAIKNALAQYNEEYTNVDTTFIPSGDLPYFTPDEMIDFGVFAPIADDNYFNSLADNDMISPAISVREWFNNYNFNFGGFDTQVRNEYASMWVNAMHKLYSTYGRIKESGDISKINARKQSILEMGWNPEVPFTPENRVKAKNRIRTVIESTSTKTDFVDLREMDTSADMDSILEANVKEDLYPVYIVLIEGTSIFSKGIKLVTRGTYSHAALAFDPSLNEIYSFGVLGAKNPDGGFIVEDVSNYHKDNHMAVFTIFMKKDDYKAVHDKVMWFKDHAEETAYSYKNILTYLFHIPHNEDTKMICSQFVDRILKLVHIDLTHKDSSLVNPNEFKKASTINKKIYIVFENIVKLYNSSRIKRMITSLIHKAKPIEERALLGIDESKFTFYMIEASYDIAALTALSSHSLTENSLISEIYESTVKPLAEVVPYTEAKEFPVQFDDEGNLLIKNLKRINYAEEYSISHRLLMEYAKMDNIDGMKYELSKLWMMNILIDRAIRRHSKDSNILYVSRAHIINDFKKYLALVQAKDKSFNFTKYYDDSPFSSAALKINGPTMKYTIDMIKHLLKA